MNKAELINATTDKVGLSKKEVENVIDTILDTIVETLQKNEEVSLTSFGTFSAKYRAARGGVNPQKPSERIQIPAVTVPKFKAGSGLKKALKESTPQEG